jgi:hypothetical protein
MDAKEEGAVPESCAKIAHVPQQPRWVPRMAERRGFLEWHRAALGHMG